MKEGAEPGLRSLSSGRALRSRWDVAQPGDIKRDSAGLISAPGRYHLKCGWDSGDGQRNDKGLGCGISSTLEIVGYRGTGHNASIGLQRSDDVGREGIAVSRGDYAVELHGIDAGLIDGKVWAAVGVGNVRAVTECVAVEFQRITGDAGLRGGGVGRQQADRWGGPGWALGNGKVQDGALGGAGIAYSGIGTRIARRYGTDS